MLPAVNTRYQIPDTRYRKSKGFTLIELLIVITIIGLLVILAVFSYGNVQAKARDSKRKADLAEIKKSLDLYRQDKDGYPQQLSALSPDYSTVPTDPKSESNYIYSPANPHSVSYQGSTITVYDTYSLTACLENPNDYQKDITKNVNCTTTSASYTTTNPQ